MTNATPIPLIDLKAQYDTIRDEIEPAVREVFESQWFILGPNVAELESQIASLCGTTHAVGCGSGSDALLLALMAHDIGPGDEVICPTYTFFATGGTIHRLGATPVFVDNDPETFNIDLDAIRAAAKRCTRLKAIMPVHLYGQAVDMDALLALAAELGVPVLEDAAQAIGTRDATGAAAGSRGSIGCFSFFPTKNLGGFGEGGICTTNDDELAARMIRLHNHGMEPKYVHHEVGLNSRLDALQAAILLVKLRHLAGWTAARQANAAFYDEAFAALGARAGAGAFEPGDFPLHTPRPAVTGAEHIYNQYVVRVPAEQRDAVRAAMGDAGIGSEIYYPIPMHLQTCFAHLGHAEGSMPHAELAARETIALPIYAELTDEQKTRVVEGVAAALASTSAVAAG